MKVKLLFTMCLAIFTLVLLSSDCDASFMGGMFNPVPIPTTADSQLITVGDGSSNDHATITAALAAAAAVAASGNHILVWVEPGNYFSEAAITVPQYVTLAGYGIVMPTVTAVNGKLITYDQNGILDVSGSATIGEGVNYTAIGIDGTVTLVGTARVKKEFTVPLSDFNPGSSGPTAALQDIFASYEFTIDDDMHTSFEVPSDCDTTENITIEVYWGIDEIGEGDEVQWSSAWRAIAAGEVVSAGASGTIDFGDVAVPATANTIVKTTGIIAAASISQDDLIALNGSRVALDGGSDPTAEPYIVMINIEYYVNKLGEDITP